MRAEELRPGDVVHVVGTGTTLLGVGIPLTRRESDREGLPVNCVVTYVGDHVYGHGTMKDIVSIRGADGHAYTLHPKSLVRVRTEAADQMRHPTHQSLVDVFNLALAQTADGKGAERHGSAGTPFEAQPIVTIGKGLGSNHFELGQAIKKLYESARLCSLGRANAARAELLGAINYAGAAHLLLEGLEPASEKEGE